MTRLSFFFLLGWMAYGGWTSAQDLPLSKFGIDTTAAVPEGLPVGMYAPLFSGQDADGNQVALSELMKQSSTVLVFIQGRWSRHDRKFLSALNDSISVIADNAAQVVVISTEKSPHIADLRDRYPSLKIISDSDGSIATNYDVYYTVTKAHARRYNLFNRAKLEANQSVPGKLPVPAVYTIGASGKVRYRYFSYDRKQRPSVRELGEVTKGIANERRQ